MPGESFGYLAKLLPSLDRSPFAENAVVELLEAFAPFFLLEHSLWFCADSKHEIRLKRKKRFNLVVVAR